MTSRPDLLRTGKESGPSPVRRGRDYTLDAAGLVRRTDDQGQPAGLSAFDSEQGLVTAGRIWRLPAEAALPEGLEACQGQRGHYTIRPSRDMTEAEYLQRLEQLPWEDTGRVRSRRPGP